MRQGLLRTLISLLAGVVFLAGVIAAGKLARGWLRSQDRYSLPFASIECDSPPGMERGEFLDEVQYLSSTPDRLRVPDDNLPRDLAHSFALHPWVEKVERVEVIPPRQVRAHLQFRTPVLAVKDCRGVLVVLECWDRMVDAQGVLLPGSVDSRSLPIFHTATQPAGPAGTPWGDPAVARAARTAAFLVPHQDLLNVSQVIVCGDEVMLTSGEFAYVNWGRPPGEEGEQEASAADKVRRLVAYCREHGSLAGPGMCVHDVRSRDRAIHHSLD